MKLAEALQLRKELSKAISELRSKISKSLILQEGNTPLYKVDEKYDELVVKNNELSKLIASINYTNNISKIQDGALGITKAETISEALISRDCLQKRLELAKTIVGKGKDDQLESKDEVRFMPFVDVGFYDTKADELQNQLQDLERKLQMINWHVDLIKL